MEGYKPYIPKPKRQISQVEIGEFKGFKTLSLPVGRDGEAFTFGMNKAKAILTYIREIEKFVNDGGQ
jgi:hypothetical protein